MNEADYVRKNYGDRGGCYPSRSSATGYGELYVCF